ncbi:MAG: hypothetical protein Q7Q71_13440 [Verrucomicrobiota bacterium JB023]|nr:hypothetical protein [Verrucomicrobiota bacterium JB023]
MKILPSLWAALCLGVTLAPASEQLPSWNTMATAAKPTGRGIEERFADRHRFLVSDAYCTRIPTGAILNLPERFEGQVSLTPVGQIVDWRTFLQRNGSWLRTHPVSWEQVTAKTIFDEQTSKHLAESPYLVVALFKNHPITVLTQKQS